MRFKLPAPVLVVELSLPPGELYPRGGYGKSWHGKSAAVLAHRSESAQKFALAMREHGVAMLEAITIRAVFFFKSSRNFRDPDNCLAGLKAAIDGMELSRKGRPGAGLVKNDKHVTPLPCVRLVDKKRPRVEVRVYDGAVEFYEEGVGK